MIYLSQNSAEISSVLQMSFGETAISNSIELYHKAYGVQYDFAQFYIQLSDNNEPSALIMRYNRSVYCLTDALCDIEEISEFIGGYTDTEVISDIPLNIPANCQKCAVMSFTGSEKGNAAEQVSIIQDAKLITSLVGESLSEDESVDFFLNTAHQMRHNLLSVYGILKENKLLSVASVYVNEYSQGFVPFVYTSGYFRGNGLSRSVLEVLCSNPMVTYRLLCEEHNVGFYKRCGFSKAATCYKYDL